MCLKIRCDEESEKFCKIFWELNKALLARMAGLFVIQCVQLHFRGKSLSNRLCTFIDIYDWGLGGHSRHNGEEYQAKAIEG